MERFTHYEVIGELGRGATARVVLARHLETQEKVSLKIFHPQSFKPGSPNSRVEREVRVASSLVHPNIVQIREFLRNSDPPALVMDYIDGESLEKYQPRLPYVLPEVSALIVIEILKALSHAHKKGIIHRDLKPENVLVAKNGHVFVTDFGLAREQEASLLTQSNVILGSIDYMSPEQAKGDSVGPASDLFSVSTLFYFLVTGTRPFSRSNLIATLSAIREEAPEPVHKRNPKISMALGRIIHRGLSKNPADRFQTADQYIESLQAHLTEIGFQKEAFPLKEWMEEPSAFSYDALQTISETLIRLSENALALSDKDAFLENISHLYQKAPSSPAIQRLELSYQDILKQESTKKKRKWLFLLIPFLLLIGTATGYFVMGKGKQPAPPALPLTKPMAPVIENVTPVGTSLGTVIFKAAPDIGGLIFSSCF